MKNGWQTETLADLCEVFADGDWIESKDQSANGIRLIQTGNVGEGVFKDRSAKARYVSNATFTRLRCTEIFEGDCLISRLPDPVGRSCILPDTGERMITAVDCTIVRFNAKQMIPEFFNFYSQSLDYLKAVDGVTTGTTRNRISRSNLGEVCVPVPPLPEQRRIVGILDEAFAGIATAKANAEKNLQNARALFESFSLRMFEGKNAEWEQETMVEVCSVITCGVASTPKYVDEQVGIPFLSAQNVKDGEVVLEKYRFVSREFHEKLTKKNKPTKGDILYSRVGAKYGEAAVVEHDFEFSVYVSLTLIRPHSERLSSYFLMLYLNSPLGKAFAKKSITSSGVPNLNVSDVRKFPVAFPSIEQQHRIVDRLTSLAAETKRLESIYQRKLAALDELKKSLLHQAFSGEL